MRPAFPAAEVATIAASRSSLYWLLAAAALTVLLWQLPYGRYALYPFTILSTWFHEMGHGLAALLLGGSFEKLELFSDGSGIATHRGPLWLGSLGSALVAAGGPLGAPIAGAIFILLGRYPRWAHYSLYLLGIILLASTLIWVRTGFGVMILWLLAAFLLLIAARGSQGLQSFTLQFIGVQACISSWQQVDYLFTRAAEINGKEMLSDTGQIARHLFLPHWLWAGLIIVLTLFILWLSLRIAYRPADGSKSLDRTT